MQREQAPKRRSALGWLMAGLVAWVVVLLAGIVALFAGAGPDRETAVGDWASEEVRTFGDGDNTIAMIEVTGEIVGGRGEEGLFSSSGYGAEDLADQLRQAKEDDDVEGVIVRLNTPGGAVVASDQVYRAVEELSEDKPVVALMEDTAASGGYYIAAGADHIIANRSTLTGSIGVIAMFPNVEGAARKLGISTVVVKSGELKDMASPFRRLSGRERRILQALIDESYGQFVEAVVKGRGMPEQRVRQLADGRVYSGAQAQRAGLIDELGDLEAAVRFIRGRARLEGGETVVRYERPSFGLGEALLGARNRTGIARDVREAVRGAREELTGVRARPGLHYLWLP